MKAALVPVERIERQIVLIRGQKVLLDSQLSPEEFADMRWRNVISSGSLVPGYKVANCGASVTLVGHGKEP